MISIKQISGELAFNGLQAAEGEKIVYGEDVNVQQTEKLLFISKQAESFHSNLEDGIVLILF